MEAIWLYQFRLIVIGDSTVGKSCLIRRFTEGRFPPASDPTVGVDFFSRLVEVEAGKRVKLQIWDTAGQERFRWGRPAWVRGVGGGVGSAPGVGFCPAGSGGGVGSAAGAGFYPAGSGVGARG